MNKDIGKAASSRIVLISGTDGFLVVEALRHLLHLLGADAEGAEMEQFPADSRPPSDWIGAASAFPFFSDVRVVVVRGAGRVPPSKSGEGKIGKTHPLVEAMKSLPDTSRLILVGDEESGSPDRLASVKEALTKWGQAVAAAEGVVVKVDPDPGAVVGLIQDRAKSLDMKMSAAAAQKLSMMTGGQAGLALGELDKLALYVHPAGEIREADVERLVVAEAEYNVFQIADSVFKGQPGPALAQLEKMMAANPGYKLQGEALSRIFPILHRQVRLTAQARLCVEARCSPSSPTPEVAALLPEKPNITGEKDWLQRKLMELARGVGFPQLRACLRELEEGDAKLKGILPAFSTEETLSAMVLKMAEACRPPGRA